MPYDPEIVKKAVCLREGGAATPAGFATTYPVTLNGRCDALLVLMDSGYWSQTLTETFNKPKRLVPGSVRGWRAEESVKRVDTWSRSSSQAMSDALELTPVDDPFASKPGDKLRVLVTWQGKPRRGVPVAYDGDVRGVTGSDGQINIRLRHGGSQIIAASVEDSIRDPDADKIVRGAILQFDIRGKN